VRPSLSHGRRHWSAVSRDVSRLSYGRAVCNRRRACQVAKPKMAISIPDDTAELVWQAAESLYTLGSCLREGEVPFVPMADAARALHHVADRFPAPMQDKRTVMALRKHMRSEFRGRSGRRPDVGCQRYLMAGWLTLFALAPIPVGLIRLENCRRLVPREPHRRSKVTNGVHILNGLRDGRTHAARRYTDLIALVCSDQGGASVVEVVSDERP